ncbi:TadE/TadG family type IV pilus assembly protein [Streptacidiphilus neutrinimicus]|uniref:TadE/TadG family type IV pilus assembly protein n=1 Tax=Streptacidiphilus neutrinimicus TaxID=105420 RepID=UPI000694CD2A|nr:TadE/TadG family type IV pilus assembly protein [Streptacidiphilus neutrinimicus]
MNDGRRSGGRREHGADEAGSLSLETVLVLPVILAFFTFVIAVGTLQDDRGTMDAAVQAAARAGSLTRDPTQVQGNVTAAADVVFKQGGLPECMGSVGVAVNGVGAAPPKPPAGYYNVVEARGSCTVQIDFGLLTLSEPVRGDFTSVVDTYRGQ